MTSFHHTTPFVEWLTPEQQKEMLDYYNQLEWCECSLGDWN
jgi:hypothetical protein